MGRAKRWASERLGTKLLEIREARHLTQEQLIQALEVGDRIDQTDISKFERGLREPPLPLLLRYGKLARVRVETLIDDRLNLPKR